MEKHETAFIKHGFDNIDFVGEDIINDADLATMGINDPQDKHDLMEALKRKGYSQGNNDQTFMAFSKVLLIHGFSTLILNLLYCPGESKDKSLVDSSESLSL